MRLHGRTPDQIRGMLERPDCIVTNKKDKKTQLDKIQLIDALVKRHAQAAKRGSLSTYSDGLTSTRAHPGAISNRTNPR